jgi:hypothetical protein
MGWSAWIPMGNPPGGLIGRPATLTRNSHMTNVYVCGVDNALWQLACQEGRWLGWSRHDDGMPLASAPAVGSMGPEHEIIFAAGVDGALWSKWCTTGTEWSEWTSLGAPGVGLLGNPAATRRDHPGCDVYVRGGDHALWQLSYQDDSWHGWRRLGGKFASDPGAVSLSLDHEMVFAVGSDGDVQSNAWTAADGWRGWDSLGSPNGGVTGGPCAVSHRPGAVQVYVQGADDALWQREYRNAVWHGWLRHEDGAALAAGLAACSRGPDHELLVSSGRDAQLYLKWWEPNLHTVDVNLIRVGIDHELTDRELASSLGMARSICLHAGLNVGTVSQFRIGSHRSGALEVVDSLAEAEELSDRWTVPGNALDIFLVRSLNVAGGWLTVSGRGGTNSTDTSGDVLRDGILASRGCPSRMTIVCDSPGGTVSSLRRNRYADRLPIRDAEMFLRATLRDGSADVTVRAAAATWLSRFAPAQAEALLHTALDSEQSTLVRHKIVAGLGRVGSEESLSTLAELIRSDPKLASHAAFTQSVIAHRAGIGGYEPATAEESPLAPAPDGSPSSQLLETYETMPTEAQLPGDAYGLIVGRSVAGLRCGDRRLVVAIDLTALARLLTTPTIAGLVATRARSDGSLHTCMLVLCWPAGDNTAHVSVHHPSGTPAFVGSARIAGTSVSFRLTAVRTPGGRCGNISGTITSGIMADISVNSGEVLSKLTPEPI